MNTRSIAAIGDVSNSSTWSGVPYHFWQAALKLEFATHPWSVDINRVNWQRWAWNAFQIIRDGKAGGFQYSDWFYNLLLNQIQPNQKNSEVISFNQFFPRPIHSKNKISYYLDATVKGLINSYGLGTHMSARMIKRTLDQEKTNFQKSHRIISFQRWTSDSIINEYNISKEKVFSIIPGANLTLPESVSFPKKPIEALAIERPLRLCFVGKDWERKGLLRIIGLSNDLKQRGFKCKICVIGGCPQEHIANSDIEYHGFLNKSTHLQEYIKAIQSCDIGCLFSSAEASSISVLEFLRLGVPVAAFIVDGMADLVPPDASIRFTPTTTGQTIADTFEELIRNPDQLDWMKLNAQCWSPYLTWERCIQEFKELWETGTLRSRVQPWLGLPKKEFNEDSSHS